jgi:hypothetical protein
MTITIEVINQKTINLLREMEKLGLIHMQISVPHVVENTIFDNERSNRWLRGCCKNLPEGSVDDFFERCRADKKCELGKENHQEGSYNA